MMRSAVGSHSSLRTTLWIFSGNALWGIVASQLRNSVISRSLLHKIVTEHQLFEKLCARWVPKQVAPEHKAKRMESALTVMQDGEEVLDWIITSDERWITHINTYIKRQSMHWSHGGLSWKTKFKQTLSWKVMCTVLWDRRGILLVDFRDRDVTVNAERYCETLQKLRRAIQNKGRGLLAAGVVFLHDNALQHTARWPTHLQQEFSWEVFNHPHPPYNRTSHPVILIFSYISNMDSYFEGREKVASI